MAITTINESDLIKDSRTVINNNFTELDTNKAPLNSPALTGTPTAPTPTHGDDSTKIATTEYVQDALDGATPTPIPDEEIEEYWSGVDPEALSEFLPLSGGTMTGNIILADGGIPLSTAGGMMEGDIVFRPHIMGSSWENISHGNSLVTFHGEKGTIESDKRISLTSFVTRDATGTDSDDGFSRYSCLETEIDPSGNVSVVLLCYKNEANVQTSTSLSLSYNADGTKSAKFDGKEIDRINASGSNYIRYENGLQIVFDRISVSMSGAESTGTPASYTYYKYRKAVYYNLPATFVDNNNIAFANTNESVNYWLASVNYCNSTQALIRVMGDNNTSTQSISFIAVGRWK